MAERGCGFREKGGAYFSIGTSRFGRPVEDFLVEPVPLDVNAVGLTPIGMQLIPAEWHEVIGHVAYDGDLAPADAAPWFSRLAITAGDEPGRATVLADLAAAGLTWIRRLVRPALVLDWIGSQFYANVADFVEEVRRLGLSRRVRDDFPWDQLTPGSRHCLVHARGFINWPGAHQADRSALWQGYPLETFVWRYCPKGVLEHTGRDYESMCAGLWWEDVTGGTPLPEDAELWTPSGKIPADRYTPPNRARLVTRRMPSFSYTAACPPDDQPATGTHSPAIFAAFPIMSVDVVADPETGRHTEIAERIRRSAGLDLDVTVVAE